MDTQEALIRRVQAELLRTPAGAQTAQQLAYNFGAPVGMMRRDLGELEAGGHVVRVRGTIARGPKGDDLWRLPSIRQG